MRSLPAEVLSQLESLYATTCLLLKFEFDEPLRFTNLDVDVWVNEERYISVPFTVDESSKDSRLTADSVVIKFDNVSLIPVEVFLNSDQRGKACEVFLAFINDLGNPISVVSLFDGVVDSVKLPRQTAEITVVSDLTYFAKSTFRKHSALCPWRFRDENCKYSGFEQSCDKTFECCKKLGNEMHFGGFRYLPSITEKQLPWGRKS